MAISERGPIVRNADGTPKLRKNGKPQRNPISYQVMVDRRDPITGNRNRVVVGSFQTRKAAEKAERDAMAQRDTGRLVDPSSATVADVMAQWLRSKAGEVSANSLADYEQVVRLHIVPAIGGAPAQKLSPAAVQSQLDSWRESGMSARLAARALMVMRQAFDQAERHGVVHRNPCALVKSPRIEKRTVQTWNAAEIEVFLDAAEHRPILNRGGDTGRRAPDPLWPLWPLLALEGMRKGEALGLRWRDVDFDRGVASIAQTVVADRANTGRVLIQSRAKTAAGSRAVRLTPQTLAALKEHRKRQAATRLAAPEWVDNDLVICTSRGTPINPGGNVNRSMDAILKAARMPDGSPLRPIRVHDLRHSAATMMLANGIPVKIVSERLGHATTAITADLYQHVSETMQADAAEAIGAAMDRARANRSAG